MPRMPLLTRLLAAYLDHGGRKSIVGLDLGGIRRARAQVEPAHAPFTWVTGAVPRRVAIHDDSFPARDGARVGIRVYLPQGAPDPALILYLHGGGWVLGNVHGYDPLCGLMAEQTPAVVVSVDYRLAPEHPAPQAVHDCVDALRWAAGHAPGWGADAGRLGIAGDSAGGNLSAVVTHVIRDEGGPRIAHQALVYPATDATCSFPSVRERARAPILTKAAIDAFLTHYLAGSELTTDHPLVSPLWAGDHHDLPPALIQTADIDPLRDEGLAYGAKLIAAGVPVRVTNYLGVPHGFMSFPGATTCGAQARAELVTELRRHLTTAGAVG